MSRELTRDELKLTTGDILFASMSQSSRLKLIQKVEDHDAAQRQLMEAWREWAHFVWCDGSEALHTDVALRDKICRDFDALTARIAELEQALRLHLAVSPDDPLLLTPVEQQLAASEALNRRAGVDLLAREGEAIKLRQRVNALEEALDSIRDSVLHGRHQLEGYEVDNDVTNAVLGIIDDATPAALSQDGVRGKERKDE